MPVRPLRRAPRGRRNRTAAIAATAPKSCRARWCCSTNRRGSSTSSRGSPGTRPLPSRTGAADRRTWRGRPRAPRCARRSRRCGSAGSPIRRDRSARAACTRARHRARPAPTPTRAPATQAACSRAHLAWMRAVAPPRCRPRPTFAAATGGRAPPAPDRSTTSRSRPARRRSRARRRRSRRPVVQVRA